jgi:RimJ/RimL family protein N-acetyltransferase
MAITIRQTDISDIDSIHDFFNRFFRLKLEGLSLRPDGMTVDETRKYLPNTVTDRNKLCLMASWDNEIAGVLSFSRYQKFEYRHCGDFGMAIMPEFWRRGIGTQLLTEQVNWCCGNDITKIELGVWSNNISAITLYEKFGFQHEGKRIGSIIRDEKTIDLILMGKHIG